ncbi:MAG: type II toxin-antitoxin system VapB family antitoxin [Sphingomonas sp.]|uniref:type II toxin-antitoxin system VapB family antitoxin n=1 Tax=Sphingomonas sp. TaxID=28214 RepID=UPI0022743A69|nr:type II toxin-antitoxin system VapB family antitoxin [Sphingomonas sp.]MCX8477261.1 type II toxin-antitoxin system VapB family antitoxin [Sphingomonas sp.]
MGAQLNIKDAETVRLARELADATGQPVTKAIRQALERELQRREEEIQETIARVQEISREFRAHMPADWHGKTSKEIMDEIYDEDGLPK